MKILQICLKKFCEFPPWKEKFIKKLLNKKYPLFYLEIDPHYGDRENS